MITGGAGFIGTNAAKYFSANGHQVVIFDNLSRHGSYHNAQWLRKNTASVSVTEGDVRNYQALLTCVRENAPIDAVIHLAGQVAVTTSVVNPRDDFEVNALGTLNVLEALRLASSDSILLYSS